MADAARHLQAGERPPEDLTARLQLRTDELGGLARSFSLMTDHVLARHEELTALVADKTRWLQEANGKLTETQQRIEAEIGLAKTVQQALVPQGSDTVGNLTLCSRMTPARQLGGDFINIHRHPGGPRLGRQAVRRHLRCLRQGSRRRPVHGRGPERHRGRGRQARRLARDLREANRTLCEANPLGMFVTGVIAMIDTTTGRLEYVCAGHEPPLGRRPGKQLSRLGGTDNIPLDSNPPRSTTS